MVQILDPLLIMGLVLNFVALGVSRIRGVINAVAVQGVLLGVSPCSCTRRSGSAASSWSA